MSEALADTRVVLVNGARQAGKSTLTRLAADGRPGTVVRLLDDAATLRAARDDPAGFVEHDGLMVIDEIQLAPELLRAIKVLVDLDPRPGRFLLTGSSRVLALRQLPDALPGRMEVIELWPFSQGEMHGGPDAFIDAAFRRGAGLEHSSRLRKRDYLELAVAGGFPEAVRRTPRRRAAFFASYLSTLIERDVLEVSSIERQGDMFRLLALLAGRVSGLLVPATLAGQAGIPRTTLVRYLELLATVFLIKSIPAWSSGQTARAIGTPKLAFVDTGIACHLIGQDAARLDEPGGAAGPVLENFVVMELARQLTWAGSAPASTTTARRTSLRSTPSSRPRTAASWRWRSRPARPSGPRTSRDSGTWQVTSATNSSRDTSSTPASRPSLRRQDQGPANRRTLARSPVMTQCR